MSLFLCHVRLRLPPVAVIGWWMGKWEWESERVNRTYNGTRATGFAGWNWLTSSYPKRQSRGKTKIGGGGGRGATNIQDQGGAHSARGGEAWDLQPAATWQVLQDIVDERVG